MSVTLGSLSTGSHLHGTANVPPWEFSASRQRFFGVNGEQNLLGGTHSRYITIALHLTGYASHLLLHTAVSELSTLIGETGSLIIDLGGGDSSTFTQCIFEGFEPSEPPWKDGSGTNGWQQSGTMKFRQVST